MFLTVPTSAKLIGTSFKIVYSLTSGSSIIFPSTLSLVIIDVGRTIYLLLNLVNISILCSNDLFLSSSISKSEGKVNFY